jgi:hypothetical protein
MNGEPTDIGPRRPTRDDRAAVAARVVEQLSDRVAAALHGDRDALLELLQAASEGARRLQTRAPGTVEEVAADAHRFADEVADCYSADRAPSDRMCDLGFSLADHVEALAIEVLHRRGRAGIADHAALPESGPSPAQEARHLARAHVAALRDAAAERRVVTDPDVQAARDMYRAIVALNRRFTTVLMTEALIDSSSPPPRPPAVRRR